MVMARVVGSGKNWPKNQKTILFWAKLARVPYRQQGAARHGDGKKERRGEKERMPSIFGPHRGGPQGRFPLYVSA